MKDFSQIVPDAAAFDRKLQGALSTAVSHAITVATIKARSDHGWQDRTRATRQSLEGVFSLIDNGSEGVLEAKDNAARLAFGTKPHVIAARNAKMLRFQVGGETIFRRSVFHPGTSPDPYLDAAADVAGEDLFAIFESQLDALL